MSPARSAATWNSSISTKRGELFPPWRELIQARKPDLYERLVIETSQSGGVHCWYKCEDTVQGNQKLAERFVVPKSEDLLERKGKKYTTVNGKEHLLVKRGDQFGAVICLIETRGEGGQGVVYPTPGYVLKKGAFTGLPTVTEEEHEVLLNVARALNEFVDPDEIDKSVPQQTAEFVFGEPEGKRPGDEFNERGEVVSILSKHGWARVPSSKGNSPTTGRWPRR